MSFAIVKATRIDVWALFRVSAHIAEAEHRHKSRQWQAKGNHIDSVQSTFMADTVALAMQEGKL